MTFIYLQKATKKNVSTFIYDCTGLEPPIKKK